MEIDVELNRRSERSESNVCDRNDDENRVADAEGQGSARFAFVREDVVAARGVVKLNGFSIEEERKVLRFIIKVLRVGMSSHESRLRFINVLRVGMSFHE